MKIRVLIVDDNPLEVEYLKTNVDWETLEFEICAVAYNGRRGIRMYETYHPDLVIADIQMPGMNGIEMIRALREKQEDVCVVFLSSYEVFEYAKAGFELGVVSYILKQDIGTDKVQEALFTVKQKIENTRKVMYHMQCRKFRNLLDTREPDESVKNKKEFTMAVLFIDEGIPVLQFGERKQMNKWQGEEKLESDLMENEIFRIYYGDRETLLLWAAPEESLSDREQEKRTVKRCEELLEWYKKAAEAVGNTSQIRICLLGMRIAEAKIRDCYQYWNPWFDQRFLTKSGTLLSTSDLSQLQENPFFLLCREDSNEIELDRKIMKLYQEQKSVDIMCSYVQECMEKMISGRKLQSIFRGLSILFQDCEEELLRCDTVAAALELWKAKICVSDEEQKVYGKGYSKITCEVIGYLKNHYHIQNLDINQIADYVSMSTSRLRTVFKEEVGQTLGQYLTDLRMNRAKHLLLETNWKSDQIAEEVGYLDGKYFRKMFKQKYGITPREYREKNWT